MTLVQTFLPHVHVKQKLRSQSTEVDQAALTKKTDQGVAEHGEQHALPEGLQGLRSSQRFEPHSDSQQILQKLSSGSNATVAQTQPSVQRYAQANASSTSAKASQPACLLCLLSVLLVVCFACCLLCLLSVLLVVWFACCLFCLLSVLLVVTCTNNLDILLVWLDTKHGATAACLVSTPAASLLMGKHCTTLNAEKQHTWLSSEDANVPQAHWKPSNMLLIPEVMGNICVGFHV